MEEVRYSIKDLENFTQIKAHTIRIWEQRYGLLSPKRTKTNIRYYSENDLKKILNINLLYVSGYKISKIASLSDDEIIDASKKIILKNKVAYSSNWDELIVWIIEFNNNKIFQYLNNSLQNQTLEELYEHVIMSVFERIGQLWQVDSISVIHEHYFSNIFKEFLIDKIRSLNNKLDTDKSVVLFLHDDEEHEFGILLYYYICKNLGYTCHYFGQKVPIQEVKIAVSHINPKIVVTTFTSKLSDKQFKSIEKELISYSKKAKILISGGQDIIKEMGNRKNFYHLDSIAGLKALL